jgi:hypothetical protein
MTSTLDQAQVAREATTGRQRHHPVWSPLGLALSMMVPAAVGVVGLLVEGTGAIDWASAIVWGVVATVVFTLFSMMGKAMGMTRMDLLDLMGSNVAPAGSGASKAVGAAIHHMNGALLGIFGAYGAVLVGTELDVVSGIVWGVVLTAFALLMMTTVGSVHPAIRRGEQTDPGPAATNFGRMTPMGSLMGHVVYGAVLGLGYATWPIG